MSSAGKRAMVMLDEECVGPNVVGSRPKACGNSKGVGSGAWGAQGVGEVLGSPGLGLCWASQGRLRAPGAPHTPLNDYIR